ncbi:hypothetical protein B0H11DRAFT_1912387 [Mycena galericulata]|nr:hypothetical protein B0H11DRAFT_1912387 [Mycena galericulata]
MSSPSFGKIHTAQGRRGRQRPYDVLISTIDELGQEATNTNDINRRLTRRTHSSKNLKDGSELVWPPRLRVLICFNINELIIIPREAALLEGLYAHALLCVEQGRDLRRDIHRNKYIAESILRTTKKTRTMKQVGSRLQQLATTSKDERLTSIILYGYVPEAVVKSLISTCPRFTTPDLLGFMDETLRLPVTVMSTSARYPSLFPEVVLGKSTQAIQLRTVAGFQPQTHIRFGMDPTVLLLSPIELASPSTWEVFRENKPYWTAATMLRPDGIHEGNYRYITSIAIDLWEAISADMNSRNGECIEWTIVHLIYRLEDDPNHPFAELVYTFEPVTSKPTLLVERSTDNSKCPFRYMHMIHPPSKPTAKSKGFPGTPLPKKKKNPPIPGTFIEENIEVILKRQTKKSLKSSSDDHPSEITETANMNTRYISSLSMTNVHTITSNHTHSQSPQPPLQRMYSVESHLPHLYSDETDTFYPNPGHTTVQPWQSTVDNNSRETPDNEEPSHPSANYVYSINGECMGHYPIPDY